MSEPSSDLQDLLRKAAELRAAGRKWDAVAADLGRRPATVRRWPILYPDLWRRAYRDAEDRLLAEAASEALMVLRNLLRSEDDKVRRDAARQLVALRLELRGLEGQADAPPAATGDDENVARYLAEHDDDQIDDLVEELTVPSRQEQPLQRAPTA